MRAGGGAGPEAREGDQSTAGRRAVAPGPPAPRAAAPEPGRQGRAGRAALARRSRPLGGRAEERHARQRPGAAGRGRDGHQRRRAHRSRGPGGRPHGARHGGALRPDRGAQHPARAAGRASRAATASPTSTRSALLAGSSPASTASAEELAPIARACRAAGVDPQSLDDVRGAGPEASAALDDYLADHAWRMVTQYSPRGQALIELPDLLVRAIRCAGDAPERAATRRGADPGAGGRGRPEGVRRPARRRPPLLRHPRRQRRPHLDVAGRAGPPSDPRGRPPPCRGGTIDEDWMAFGLGEAELAAALRGDASMGEVAKARAEHGMAAEAAGAPATLGWSEGGEPDPKVFPKAMAEITAAIIDTLVLEGMEPDGEPAPWTGDGVGVGTEPYIGRACVAASPEEALAKLEPGDVLVTAHDHPRLRGGPAHRRRAGHRAGRPHQPRRAGGEGARPAGRRRRRRRHRGDPRRRQGRGRPASPAGSASTPEVAFSRSSG